MPEHELSIVWFRNDLRLHDHPALCRALRESRCIIPVFVFDEAGYQIRKNGKPGIGVFRNQFLKESVLQLQTELRSRSADLLVFYGDTTEIIAHLCERYHASAIYFSKEYAPEELKGEQLLAQRVAVFGVQMKPCDTGSLIDRKHLPFPISRLPLTFTEFRKAVEPVLQHSICLPAPESLPLLPDMEVPPFPVLPLPAAQPDPRAVLPFHGGEESGLARLRHYIYEGHAATYFDTRNGMIGPDYSTKFSAWLAVGALSARRIYQEVKDYEAKQGANKSTYWIIFELLWRDFFRWSMERYGCLYFLPGGILRKKRQHTDRTAAFSQWASGNTPNEFVNAHMRELNATGFMSNRGRQIVASYWIHDLSGDWLWGAEYFEQTLIDYDVYSNYGNWAYIAGVGNDPRPQRYFNPLKQAAQYDPDGAYQRLWSVTSP